ncbi:MAG: NADP-dependent phosphogluconate dehydrogenase [Myxococcales bacterium]|nr:NADP-dependent phosphogluconate dehydrogenase [Myxococcales bacterium]
MSDTADFGVVGLGVMGASLALNIEEKGYKVALLDLDPSRAKKMLDENPGKRFVATNNPEEFTKAISSPRRILLMVPAGNPVDASLASLAPFLAQGDVVIDGGNEFYTKTEERQAHWAAKGIHLIGMGVSGGEYGARHGPSMMPSGDKQAYREIEPILQKIAAQVSDGPCVGYVGPGGSGHFVKMVHNGIEYGDMQLIAEVFDLLRHGAGMSYPDLADTFERWNQEELESYLVEITAKILRKADDRGQYKTLLDAILDTAKMKGTGSWTVKEGAELATPIPTIASSVEARLMSGLHPLRQKASEVLVGPLPTGSGKGNSTEWVNDAKQALYAAKICSYAQGMELIRKASDERSWNLDLAEVTRTWKAGCIIRAHLLKTIQSAFNKDPGLPNLLMDGTISEALAQRQDGWRRTMIRIVESGISAPSMMSSLSYYDGLRRKQLPANLTQAQRDFFGAHTYQRRDKEGSFHTDWSV